MSKPIKIFVDGIYSHTDLRQDVFSSRSSVIYNGLIYKVKTIETSECLRVELTTATKENFKGGQG
tara:strand:+ start:1103 stop:1297 length:195 start_codon:yes stop_codon:yes gene_type:complete